MCVLFALKIDFLSCYRLFHINEFSNCKRTELLISFQFFSTTVVLIPRKNNMYFLYSMRAKGWNESIHVEVLEFKRYLFSILDSKVHSFFFCINQNIWDFLLISNWFYKGIIKVKMIEPISGVYIFCNWALVFTVNKNICFQTGTRTGYKKKLQQIQIIWFYLTKILEKLSMSTTHLHNLFNLQFNFRHVVNRVNMFSCT